MSGSFFSYCLSALFRFVTLMVSAIVSAWGSFESFSKQVRVQPLEIHVTISLLQVSHCKLAAAASGHSK